MKTTREVAREIDEALSDDGLDTGPVIEIIRADRLALLDEVEHRYVAARRTSRGKQHEAWMYAIARLRADLRAELTAEGGEGQ